MQQPGPDGRPRPAPGTRVEDVALLLALGLTVHVLGTTAVLLAPAGATVASWWPAAGLGVGLCTVLPARQRPVVLLAVLLGSLSGNVAGGREVGVAVLFAVANVVEVAVTTRLLVTAAPARLDRMVDLRRLVVAVVAGAAVLGLLVSTGVVLLLDARFVATFVAVVPSHAAAQLVVVPAVLALTTPPRHRRWLETLAQLALLGTVTAVVFSLGAQALTFLPLTALVWGAVRLGLRTVTLELLLLVVSVMALSASGRGPFAVAATAPGTPGAEALLVQVFAVSSVVVVLPLTLAVREREEATERLAASEQLFRGGFTQSLLGMLMLTPRQGALAVLRANPVACRMLGGDEVDVVGADFGAFLDPSEHEGLSEAVADLLAGRSTGWRHEMASASSPVRWFDVALSVLPGGAEPSDDVVLGVQVVDVTARRDAEAQLARLALHDPLTGLANRVLLADRLSQVLGAAQRSGRGPALLFLDLDDFKRVNDVDGHATGDAVLRAVADRLVATARSADTVARIGGDEFVVLCPETADADRARSLAERIVGAASLPIAVGDREVVVRVSVGVVLGAATSTADELLRDADTAMYEAKSAGKDRVVVFRADAHAQPA